MAIPTARRWLILFTCVGLAGLLAGPRDSAGRVATQSPHVPPPDGGGSTFVPAGGSVTDPVAMAQMHWNEGGPPPLNDVVFKNRILPNTDAETLAGDWETDDPFASKPSQVGILVQIRDNRRVLFQRGKVAGSGPQKITSLDVRVYERVAGKDKGGWFSTTCHGGASWDGHRLRIEFKGGDFMRGQLGLDLAFNQNELTWIGSYTRKGVTKPILLARPGASLKAVSNPFLGGWSENGWGDESSCVYIAAGLDGTLLAWRDTRNGPFINSSEGRTTATFQENNGDALGVQINGDTLSLQEGLYWGGLWGRAPDKFTGKLSPDESRIIGSWEAPELESQPTTAEVTTFTRMAGQSCWSQGPK